jgi:hypothetical protein
MKRTKPAIEGHADTGQNLVDGFADTRKDLIKRKKIHRVLDFVQKNRKAYRQYLKIEDEK